MEYCEVILNLYDAEYYGDVEGAPFRLSAYQRGPDGTDTRFDKTVDVCREDLPERMGVVDDDWYGEDSPLYTELMSLFVWKIVEEQK